jgi:hypothetical protein
MRSYVKIYGPPVMKAIRALEKIAVEMPEVCIMSTAIASKIPGGLASDLRAEPVARKYRDFAQTYDTSAGLTISSDFAHNYYESSGVSIPVERCSKIISRSIESLGEYDFFFEWFKEPKQSELNELIAKVDEALTSLGCYYTITTKR